MYDIAIIGSGSAGYVAGIRGAQLGRKACVVEKGEIGGVCLNKGCIPTKAILASIEALRNMKRAEEFGINVSSPELDFARIMRRKDIIVKKLTSGVRFLLEQNGIEVVNGEASIKEPGCLTLKQVQGGGKEIRAKSIIICTGSTLLVPFKIGRRAGCGKTPSVPIRDVVSSDEALEFKSPPKSVLIIGAGAIGVEFATIFCGLGSKVTLVEMMPKILPEIKDEKITRIIRKELEYQGVEVIEDSKVEEICYDVSLLSTGEEIRSEKILVACGRVPNSEGFEDLGLKIENKKIVVDRRMQTNIPGIYAAGDVVGPPLLAHKASVEGVLAAENASGRDSEMDYEAIPSCIFSNPEIALVGKFESEVKDAKTGECRFQGVGKALCIEEQVGFAKVVADRDYKIKGVQIIGAHASDLIPIGVIGVKKGLRADELGKLIYPHPTLSECLKEALLDVTHSAIHQIRK